ncbi:MAG: argininosuccinate lyase [bacterium]
MKKIWEGRFEKGLDETADKFNASSSFDKILLKYDLLAGMAHTKALAKAKVITPNEEGKITAALKKLLKNEKAIDFTKYEDVHSAVEGELVKLIGETGKKIHTGRSRNDLVVTDTRMYLKDEIEEMKKIMKALLATLTNLAEKNTDKYMPGYTHLQHAQIISRGHWFMAYFQMFRRDLELLSFVGERANVMPLGSGALAGANYAIDRHLVAKELQFAEPSQNSLDAVADRDFVIDFLYFAAITATHVSRLSEEIIIFNSSEYSFIEIDDAFSTGSSIMPQKKNPDIAELARGKTGEFYGALMAGLTMLKGLPLAYNKDLQEDKVILFEAVKKIKEIITVFEKFMRHIKFRQEKINESLADDFMYAVDVADYLSKKGMPFRESHKLTGQIVLYCLQNREGMSKLPIEKYKQFSEIFEKDIYNIFKPEKSAHAKCTFGSASPESVKGQIKTARAFLKK